MRLADTWVCRWCGVTQRGWRRLLRIRWCRRCSVWLEHSDHPPCAPMAALDPRLDPRYQEEVT